MQNLSLFTYFFSKDRRLAEKGLRVFTPFRYLYAVIVIFIGMTAVGVTKEQSEKVELDTIVKDFTLKDADGASHALYQLSEEKPATVVLFLATQCPRVTDYAERIVTLVKTYNEAHEKKVQFIGINSNKQETIEEIAKYSKKYGFQFPVLKDPENKIADYFGARRTPEVFLLDTERMLRYAGAIDNSPKEPTKHYLKDALDLVIAGKDIPKKSKKTRAVGCTIKRIRKKDVDRTP